MTVNQHSTREPYPPLSKRELEILRLLARDFSDREIANQLVVAHSTVKWYNRQIFNKLGVENRQQAVLRALALGILKDHSHEAVLRHQLPAQLTPFIGRITELDDLERLLFDPATRMVTILAPGGMGKTRLALASAELAASKFADGVFFVPLAPLTMQEQVAPTVADAIGLQFAPDGRSPRQQILDFFRFKQSLLLLDNVEHVLDGVSLVTALLSAAPGLKVLATSRERLNLHGETVYPLGGMPYPPADANNARDYSAVQLFIACAQRSSARFVPDQADEIVHICRLVRGMPLALELAAAWVGALSPREIADEIGRSVDFLHTNMRNVPERMRSVRAVFEASWRRLTPDEQRVFARLSVFRGGFTREAAGAVAGASVAVLASLVNKALLWRQAERYDIHELLRQYAESELSKAGEDQRTQDAYVRYFGHCSNHWSKALKTPLHLEAIERLDAEAENIHQAFSFAIAMDDLSVLQPFPDLWYYYDITGQWQEGERLFRAAVDKLNGQESVLPPLNWTEG